MPDQALTAYVLQASDRSAGVQAWHITVCALTFAGGPRILSSASGCRAPKSATIMTSRRGVPSTVTPPCGSRRRSRTPGSRSLTMIRGRLQMCLEAIVHMVCELCRKCRALLIRVSQVVLRQGSRSAPQPAPLR